MLQCPTTGPDFFCNLWCRQVSFELRQTDLLAGCHSIVQCPKRPTPSYPRNWFSYGALAYLIKLVVQGKFDCFRNVQKSVTFSCYLLLYICNIESPDVIKVSVITNLVIVTKWTLHKKWILKCHTCMLSILHPNFSIIQIIASKTSNLSGV